MFPADLDTKQMRKALAQIGRVIPEGQAAIKRAEKLRKRDQTRVAKGQFPTAGRTGEKYYERIYVYRPNLSRWLDGYETSISGSVDGVVIATHSRNAFEIVRQCGELGVRHVWFHRSFGEGSVSNEAVHECSARGIQCIVGGCPLVYCEPVDFGHRCMRWLLRFGGEGAGLTFIALLIWNGEVPAENRFPGDNGNAAAHLHVNDNRGRSKNN